MAFINGRYYSAAGRYSPYVTLQIQRYKSAQANQRFLDQVGAGASSLYGAQANYAQGMSTIFAQIANKRVQDQVAANAATNAAALNTLDTTA
jgi:hypothetical protein